jgi:hypothetical protein
MGGFPNLEEVKGKAFREIGYMDQLTRPTLNEHFHEYVSEQKYFPAHSHFFCTYF